MCGYFNVRPTWLCTIRGTWVSAYWPIHKLKSSIIKMKSFGVCEEDDRHYVRNNKMVEKLVPNNIVNPDRICGYGAKERLKNYKSASVCQNGNYAASKWRFRCHARQTLLRISHSCCISARVLVFAQVFYISMADILFNNKNHKCIWRLFTWSKIVVFAIGPVILCFCNYPLCLKNWLWYIKSCIQ